MENILNYLKTHLLLVLLIFSNLIFVGTSVYFYLAKEEVAVMDCEEENTRENEEQKEKIFVEVKGRVKNPGVYEVNEENIINDVIKLAGGFSKGAYTSNINLSRKVNDELVIYVYSKSEYKKLNMPATITQPECNSNGYDINDCTQSGSSIITSGESSDNASNTLPTGDNTENKLVNINTASKSELVSISGIGDAKADAIISYRNQNGGFKSIEEIKNVSGIGDALYESIKAHITV